jgi:predicted 3-demethylubiquinone-9 3-methyltransferase (glyoxalase superfamily)
MQKIIPHLCFDKDADEASKFYMSLKNNNLLQKSYLDNPRGTEH